MLAVGEDSYMKKHLERNRYLAIQRQADVVLGKGQKSPEIVKKLRMSEYAYYRWRTGHSREALVAAGWIRRLLSDCRSCRRRMSG